MIRLLERVGYRFSVSKKTALYDWHVANKGKIVDFAGTFLFMKDICFLFNLQREC